MRATTAALSWAAISLFTGGRATAQCVDRPLPTTLSTRGLALGDANAAGRDDDVIFYGPAQLAVARGTSVAGERYGPVLASGTVATTARLATGGVGVGAQVMEGRNTESCLARPVLPNGQPPAKVITRALGVVGAAQTFKRYRFGVAVKYAAEQVDQTRISELLVDAGVSHDFTLGDVVPLTAAVSMQSIGPDPTRAIELGVPRRALLGLASGGPLGPIDLGIAAQAGVEHIGAANTSVRNRPTVGGGVEIGYTWLDGYSVALRAGVRTAYAYELNGHLTGGAGLVLDRLAVDYALEDIAGRRFAHRVGIRLR